MYLTIYTIAKTLFSGHVERVELPGRAGSFTILTDHAPLVSTLGKGLIRYTPHTDTDTLPIESGLVKVANNEIVVLVG